MTTSNPVSMSPAEIPATAPAFPDQSEGPLPVGRDPGLEGDSINDAGSDTPFLKDAASRASILIDVGVDIDNATREKAVFALASNKRSDGQNFLADFASALMAHGTHAQAQIFQDIFALFIGDFKREGFFIEVGTGDGKLISNTYLLEKEFDWSGLVVEPNPVFLEQLKQNRDCVVSTDCILDVSGRSVKFRCTADPEFSAIVDGHADLHDGRRAGEFIEIDLVTLSLNDLLIKYDCPKVIDFLSLDVEGSEFDILQTFDFENTKIKCLVVEHNWTESRDYIYNLLSDKGFVRVFEHFSQWDDWYVHRDILSSIDAARYLIEVEEDPGSDPEEAHNLVAWAVEAVQHSQWEVAQTLCLQAIKINPGFSSAFRTLAEIAMRRGKRTLALEHWRSAIAADPNDCWARIGLAEMLALRGSIGEAVNILDQAEAGGSANQRARELLEELSAKMISRRTIPDS